MVAGPHSLLNASVSPFLGAFQSHRCKRPLKTNMYLEPCQKLMICKSVSFKDTILRCCSFTWVFLGVLSSNLYSVVGSLVSFWDHRNLFGLGRVIIEQHHWTPLLRNTWHGCVIRLTGKKVIGYPMYCGLVVCKSLLSWNRFKNIESYQYFGPLIYPLGAAPRILTPQKPCMSILLCKCVISILT